LGHHLFPPHAPSANGEGELSRTDSKPSDWTESAIHRSIWDNEVAVGLIIESRPRQFMTNGLGSMAAEPKAANPRWEEIVDRYQQPAVRRALWQVANTLVPYAALWYLLLQLGVLMIAGSAGVWFFYVQHQFEGVWERRQEWDFCAAALRGSSFYKPPKVPQWFSGNIGFHHIHHLSPRIPNYNLEKCHQAEPFFQTVKPVTLFTSFKSLTFRLWDEQRGKLVSFEP
jgi:hypothetical protein